VDDKIEDRSVWRPFNLEVADETGVLAKGSR